MTPNMSLNKNNLVSGQFIVFDYYDRLEEKTIQQEIIIEKVYRNFIYGQRKFFYIKAMKNILIFNSQDEWENYSNKQSSLAPYWRD